jgi:metal-dependent amidase/aminoacylase/carboxypeptidase family protein
MVGAMEQLDDGYILINHEDAKEIPLIEPGHLHEISDFIDGITDRLWDVNKTIHDNPELGYKEFIAHETLTKFMSSQRGWNVVRSAYGLATAWVAEFDSGKKGPVVSFNVEMGGLEGFQFQPLDRC